ncbi:hypothetical protein [Rhodohalobacter halophilus]|uniref:hypothetical protein n=1 Tax=Rhodohalobacter halophilus TaxID=1812810 RepID=UPI00083FBEB0|nr:hypothetical protein [Rhodohalobacter halophilus]
MEYLNEVKIWFLILGDAYGVNPIIFGAIYVGAIPFFTLSVAWIVKNFRQDKNLVIPALSASFFFVSAYLYLMIAGENVPWWVYLLVIGMLFYGGWSTLKKVKGKLNRVDDEI